MGTHPIFESDFDCLTECNKMDFFEEILKDERRFLRSENIKKLGEFAEIIFSFAKDLENIYFGVKGKERKNEDGVLEVPKVEKYRDRANFRVKQIRKGYKSLKKKIIDESESKKVDAECQTDPDKAKIESTATTFAMYTQTDGKDSSDDEKILRTEFPQSSRGRTVASRGRGGFLRGTSRQDSSMMSGFDAQTKSDKDDPQNSRGDKSSLIFHDPVPEPKGTTPPPVPRIRRPFVKPADEFERYEHEVVKQTFESV